MGWDKDDESISLNEFHAQAPCMSKRTIERKLLRMEGEELIEITRKTYGKGASARNRYKLGPKFNKPIEKDEPVGGSVTESLPTVTESLPTVTESLPTVTPGGSVTESLQRQTNVLNPLLKKQQQQNQNGAVVVFDENVSKHDAAIAALKGWRIENYLGLITKYGIARVDLEIQRCRHALKTPGWIKTGPAAWLVKSLELPGGFNIPPGFVSEEDREKAKAEVKAEAEEKKRDATEVENDRERAKRAQEVFEDLTPEGKEAVIAKVVAEIRENFLNRFDLDRFENMVEELGPEKAVEIHLTARSLRDRILRVDGGI